MRNLPRIAIAGISLFGLTGCQAFQSLETAFFGRSVRPLPHATQSDPVVALEQGRALLRQGHAGLAIDQFLKAKSDPKFAAEAANGLGAAYAKLERYDLARRFFSEAVLLQPDDAKFARNLGRANAALAELRLRALKREATQLMAERGADSSGEQSAERGPIRIVDGKLVKTGVAASSARLQRESSGEIKLVTKDPAADSRGSRISKADANTPPARPSYPVRVVLGPATSPKSERPSAKPSGYPVRISFQDMALASAAEAKTKAASYPTSLR